MDAFLSRAPQEHIDSAAYTVELKEQLACRFLRAREFDIEGALILLHDAHELLKKHKADECAGIQFFHI